jgi:hypothetical protein
LEERTYEDDRTSLLPEYGGREGNGGVLPGERVVSVHLYRKKGSDKRMKRSFHVGDGRPLGILRGDSCRKSFLTHEMADEG